MAEIYHIPQYNYSYPQDWQDGSDTDPMRIKRHIVMLEAGSQSPLMHRLDRYRTEYIRQKGWMPSDTERTTDFDRYDEPNRWTRSFIDLKNDGDIEDATIISSIRITRVDDPEECMSFDMARVDDVEDLPSEWSTAIQEAAEAGQFYDITRMLPPSDKSVSFEEYAASFIRITGQGMYYTMQGSEDDPLWVFATLPGLHYKLNKIGIVNQLIKDSKPDDDPRHTFLCAIKPKDLIDYLSVNREKYEDTFQHLNRGIEEASGLTHIS